MNDDLQRALEARRTDLEDGRQQILQQLAAQDGALGEVKRMLALLKPPGPAASVELATELPAEADAPDDPALLEDAPAADV